jgi:hemerythrin-like domain-containing protein
MITRSLRPTKSNRLFALLKSDHKVLKTLFLEYERADLGKQLVIAQTVIQELGIHAELEEQLIYPAIRQAIEEDDLINEAAEEHHLMHVLIEELFHLMPTQDTFQAKFKVLGEVVQRHIKEEEGEMFPRAQQKQIDWEQLYEQAHLRREHLLAKAVA